LFDISKRVVYISINMLQFLKKFIIKNHLALVICFFAIAGFVAAFTLTIDKINILKNPDQTLSCNINVLLNCGVVMKSEYAEAFGIPLSLLGVAGYPSALLTGLVLIEKRKISPLLTWLTTIPPFLAFALSSWFMYVSAYLIGVFCPWCLLSALSSTCIFFAMLLIHFQENNFGLPEGLASYFQRKVRGGWHIPVITLFFLIVIFAVSYPFWIYSI
jgi:uncharacterized membrane protein